MLKRKIFVVDDDEELLPIYASALKGSFDVQTFQDPNQLVQKIQSQEIPDVVISDFYMPQLNGVELLKWLRSQNLNLPVVLMSGFSDRSLYGEALKLPPVHFMDKPFSGQFLKNEACNAMIGSLYTKLQTELVSTLEASIQTFTQFGPQLGSEPFSQALRNLQARLETLNHLADEIKNWK